MSKATPALKGFLPTHPTRIYEPTGRCIYCDAVGPLSDEHIIPLGLGGKFVLPRASCSDCNKQTGSVERTCLRTMYGPLRLLYGLPSRRERDRPDTLPLKIKRTEASPWEYVEVPKDRYPFLITFPYFEAPGALTVVPEHEAPGPATERLWIRGASAHDDFNELLALVANDLGVHSLMPESKADVPAFCSLLAKIALGYVSAETGRHTANTRLAAIALGTNMTNCRHFLGSASTDQPPTDALHELSFGEQACSRSTLVRIRLPAKLGTPTYFVVLPAPS